MKTLRPALAFLLPLLSSAPMWAKTAPYSGGPSSTYFDTRHDSRNVIDVGSSFSTAWTSGTGRDLDIATPSTGLTVAKIISDMQSPSELLPKNATLAGHDWARNPKMTQYAPTGAAIPNWFEYEKPALMKYGTVWYVLMEGQNNTSTNTRVQVKNLRMYFLSNQTKTWTLFDFAAAPWTDMWTAPFNETNTKNTGTLLRPVGADFYHGYGSKKPLTNPTDIRATFVAMEFRLVKTDASKPDDTAAARYVLDVGGDFWPDTTIKWPYAPGIGNGRMLQATTSWRTATMYVPNIAMGATLNEANTYPPPLDVP